MKNEASGWTTTIRYIHFVAPQLPLRPACIAITFHTVASIVRYSYCRHVYGLVSVHNTPLMCFRATNLHIRSRTVVVQFLFFTLEYHRIQWEVSDGKTLVWQFNCTSTCYSSRQLLSLSVPFIFFAFNSIVHLIRSTLTVIIPRQVLCECLCVRI